ncbi:MAG: Ni/Fe-hydrogenase cytochrome b subunit [Chloroflexi bacterium]|nr:Ni/Fe-hydrogenase cytochrome b subunit [Chloroflexota bacterium]
MFPQELNDTIVFLVMIGARFVFPIALVITLGYWLQRKIRRPDGSPVLEPGRRVMPWWYRRFWDEVNHLPAWLPTIGLLAVAGATAMLYRLAVGLGISTNLNQAYPWGLWIGFDLFMVAFSGGAFTLATMVYIFQMERFHAAIRPTVLTGLLGYTSVLVILLMDLGRWDRFYHFIIFPNINSALFEVSWCILLYTTVLVTEFSPVLLEKFKRNRALEFLKRITIPLVILGSTLSTLHQSSLGTLFVIMSERLHPLWYTPIIPILFFVTSIAAGISMVVAGATVSYWVFKRSLPQKLVGDLASFLPWVLGLYLVMKLGELLAMGEIELLWTSGWYSVLFAVELTLTSIVPMIWFMSKRVRESRVLSLIGAGIGLFGVFLNRFDAAWFALKPVPGYSYIPSIAEIAIQVGVFSIIIFVYTIVGHYFPLFEGTLAREKVAKEGVPVAPQPRSV